MSSPTVSRWTRGRRGRLASVALPELPSPGALPMHQPLSRSVAVGPRDGEIDHRPPRPDGPDPRRRRRGDHDDLVALRRGRARPGPARPPRAHRRVLRRARHHDLHLRRDRRRPARADRRRRHRPRRAARRPALVLERRRPTRPCSSTSTRPTRSFAHLPAHPAATRSTGTASTSSRRRPTATAPAATRSSSPPGAGEPGPDPATLVRYVGEDLVVTEEPGRLTIAIPASPGPDVVYLLTDA